MCCERVKRPLPDTHRSINHRFIVGGQKGYLTVGLYEDGTPGKLRLIVAKSGSSLRGYTDEVADRISKELQEGIPLLEVLSISRRRKFEPFGHTNNKQIPYAFSIPDYVARWMALKFLSPEERELLAMEGGDSIGLEGADQNGAAE